MHKVDEFTRSVLERGSVEGNTLKLPGQLDRSDYVKVDKVLKGLGGKWDRRAGGHVFPFDPRDLLGRAVNEGSYANRQQDGQMFWTPEPLAERMADMAKIGVGDLVLEPSAGIGRLVRPALARGAHVVAVERDAVNLQALQGLSAVEPRLGDFIAWSEGQARRFDAVLMNPPFTRAQDVAHIRAAWSLLKPGGRLVAISSESPFFHETKIAAGFRGWLAEIGAIAERLPAGTFRESGTDVTTRLIIATKAEA